ncbi:MAG TPA: cytidine deaminase [Vibrio sp.]|uniref:cytidine deaminase n=1 Tax=Vibrio sp. TaxID=678 RepID=UPI000EC3A7C4|nr:cytidine deaminase [Vibrio sp.]HCH02311.1 cytidine deaminase [Vibrio sp.]
MNSIEQELYQTAVELIKKRYPFGWGGAAAIRTQSGRILTSVAPSVNNDALALCMEVGSYLEAEKYDDAVTHSLCVCREDEFSEFLVLTPCGICQERLVSWGGDVQVAISNAENKLEFKPLRELMPHHWSIVNGIQL